MRSAILRHISQFFTVVICHFCGSQNRGACAGQGYSLRVTPSFLKGFQKMCPKNYRWLAWMAASVHLKQA
jgi:hypothetical protein